MKVRTSTRDREHQPGERKYRPETENIGAKVRTSTRKREYRPGERKYRPKTENIGAKVRTSTRKREHRPETENINPESENINPRPRTSARNRKHRLDREGINYFFFRFTRPNPIAFFAFAKVLFAVNAAWSAPLSSISSNSSASINAL